MFKQCSRPMLLSFTVLIIAVVLPVLCFSELMVDRNTTCMGCHVNGNAVHDLTLLHNVDHFIPNRCGDCHANASPSNGDVKSSTCQACHPADQAGPGVNAGTCDIINFHLNNQDYAASGESCIASDCHLGECDGETTTTTTLPVTTTTVSVDPGGCPAAVIYGEGSAEVLIMKSIRDDLLSRTPEGREIIKLYYRWAPFIAAAVRNDKELRTEIKGMIDGILELAVK